MKKEQLESFNDAVIAIIITLMVLEIKLPELTVANSIVLLRHVFIYALSFFIVAIGWLNLHLLFTNVARVSAKLIRSVPAFFPFVDSVTDPGARRKLF